MRKSDGVPRGGLSDMTFVVTNRVDMRSESRMPYRH
jgi:hypothetical protein